MGTWNTVEQNTLKAKAATLAEGFQRSSSHVEGRNGYLSLGITSCEDSTTLASARA